MAVAVSRFMILAKSDRMGKKDKKEEDKMIKYSGVLSFQKIDLSKVAKDLRWGEYWTTEDIQVKPQQELFAEVDVMGEDIRIVSLMSREEYLKTL